MPFDLSSRELALVVLLFVCDAFGLVVGARILLRRRGLVAAALVWSAFGLVWAVGWGFGTAFVLRSRFALMRVVAHVLAFVMAPLAIARGIAWIRQGRPTAGLVPLAVGVGMALVYLWASLVEPRRIEFTEQRVTGPRLAALSAPLRVAILADVQTDAVGAYEADVFRRTAAARPDLVLLPGDFVQVGTVERFAREAARFRALFDLLDPWPRLGVFAVLGDVDPDPTIFDGTRVRLVDDIRTVVAGEPGLQIVGLSLGRSRAPLDGRTRATVESFPGFSIVVGHAPDYAIPLVEGESAPPMLCVAGHTHGGQVVVPGFGPPITLTAMPRRYAAGGLFRFGQAWLSVSRGVGLERGHAPRVRMFCRPQVVLIDLAPDP